MVLQDGIIAGQPGEKQFSASAETRKIVVQDGTEGYQQIVLKDRFINLHLCSPGGGSQQSPAVLHPGLSWCTKLYSL